MWFSLVGYIDTPTFFKMNYLFSDAWIWDESFQFPFLKDLHSFIYNLDQNIEFKTSLWLMKTFSFYLDKRWSFLSNDIHLTILIVYEIILYPLNSFVLSSTSKEKSQSEILACCFFTEFVQFHKVSLRTE